MRNNIPFAPAESYKSQKWRGGVSIKRVKSKLLNFTDISHLPAAQWEMLDSKPTLDSFEGAWCSRFFQLIGNLMSDFTLVDLGTHNVCIRWGRQTPRTTYKQSHLCMALVKLMRSFLKGESESLQHYFWSKSLNDLFQSRSVLCFGTRVILLFLR